MKTVTFAVLIASATLAGCGGSTESGTPPANTGGPPAGTSAASPAGAKVEPKIFRPNDSTFEITAPSSSWKRNEESAALPDGGKIKALTYTSSDPGAAALYVAGVTEFPAEAIGSIENKDEALDNAASGLVAPYGGEIKAKEPIEFAEFPGRAISFDIAAKGGQGPRRAMARLYLINTKLYQATYIGPADSFKAADATEFLKSLVILKK